MRKQGSRNNGKRSKGKKVVVRNTKPTRKYVEMTLENVYNMMQSDYIGEYDPISIEYDDMPPFQRNDVWNVGNKIKLLESILKDISIGIILLYRRYVNGRWIYSPIDGKQRLTGLDDIFRGRVVVPTQSCMYSERFNDFPSELRGKRFTSANKKLVFPKKYLDKIRNCKVIVEFSDNITERQAVERFLQCNENVAVTSTEKRAAMGGKMCDFVTKRVLAHELFTLRREYKIDMDKKKQQRKIADSFVMQFHHPGRKLDVNVFMDMYLKRYDDLPINSDQFMMALDKFNTVIGTVVNDKGKRVPNPILKDQSDLVIIFSLFLELSKYYNAAATSKDGFSQIVSEFYGLWDTGNELERPKPCLLFQSTKRYYHQEKPQANHQAIIRDFIRVRFPKQFYRKNKKVIKETVLVDSTTGRLSVEVELDQWWNEVGFDKLNTMSKKDITETLKKTTTSKPSKKVSITKKPSKKIIKKNLLRRK